MAATMSKQKSEEEKAEKRRRQKLRRQARKRDLVISELYDKPLDDWDEEELARGRPRASDGTFSGRPPRYVPRELHEEAVRRFQEHAQAELRGIVPKALETISSIVMDDRVDDKGRPVTPRAVQLQAAQWIVEHLVGKPKVRLEADISVRLQGILAEVMVSPEEAAQHGMRPAIEVHGWDAEEDDSDLGVDSD
jgi:hypothetical protein